MISKERKKEIINRLSHQNPTVIIGKNGLTDSSLNEMANQLKIKKSIKISIPNTIEDKNEFCKNISVKLKAECLDLRGRKLILHKD